MQRERGPAPQFDRGFEHFRGNWRVESLGDGVFDWGQFAAETDHTGLRRVLDGIWRCVRRDAETLPSLKRGTLVKLRDVDVPGLTMDDGTEEALEYVRGTDFGGVPLPEPHGNHFPYLPPGEYRLTERVDVDSIRSYIDEPEVSEETARRAYDDSVRYLSDVYEEIYSRLNK